MRKTKKRDWRLWMHSRDANAKGEMQRANQFSRHQVQTGALVPSPRADEKREEDRMGERKSVKRGSAEATERGSEEARKRGSEGATHTQWNKSVRRQLILSVHHLLSNKSTV